jgi:protein PET117
MKSMHKGVERDMEKQRIRQERQAEFELQRRLEEEYRKLQTVSTSIEEQSGGVMNQGRGI